MRHQAAVLKIIQHVPPWTIMVARIVVRHCSDRFWQTATYEAGLPQARRAASRPPTETRWTSLAFHWPWPASLRRWHDVDELSHREREAMVGEGHVAVK